MLTSDGTVGTATSRPVEACEYGFPFDPSTLKMFRLLQAVPAMKRKRV